MYVAFALCGGVGESVSRKYRINFRKMPRLISHITRVIGHGLDNDPGGGRQVQGERMSRDPNKIL